jgi:hypothetical protein
MAKSKLPPSVMSALASTGVDTTQYFSSHQGNSPGGSAGAVKVPKPPKVKPPRLGEGGKGKGPKGPRELGPPIRQGDEGGIGWPGGTKPPKAKPPLEVGGTGQGGGGGGGQRDGRGNKIKIRSGKHPGASYKTRHTQRTPATVYTPSGHSFEEEPRRPKGPTSKRSSHTSPHTGGY